MKANATIDKVLDFDNRGSFGLAEVLLKSTDPKLNGETAYTIIGGAVTVEFNDKYNILTAHVKHKEKV